MILGLHGGICHEVICACQFLLDPTNDSKPSICNLQVCFFWVCFLDLQADLQTVAEVNAIHFDCSAVHSMTLPSGRCAGPSPRSIARFTGLFQRGMRHGALNACYNVSFVTLSRRVWTRARGEVCTLLSWMVARCCLRVSREQHRRSASGLTLWRTSIEGLRYSAWTTRLLGSGLGIS
jgi:hypothetical protein